MLHGREESALKILRDTASYARFLAGLPALLRKRVDPEEARELMIRRIEEREENFLALARRSIFGRPESPYLRLLSLAGCEQADLETLVRDRGLLSAMRELRAAGVYVTFEEFKGRTPLIRSGVEIPLLAESFDNPFLTRYYQGSTGGSTGAGRQVSMDIDHLLDRAYEHAVTDALQGFAGRPTAVWFDGLPGPGMSVILTRVLTGNVPDRWFSPMIGRGHRPPAKFRWAERGILWTARLSGAPVRFPQFVPLDRPEVIARWLGEQLETYGRAGLRTMVSRALRVALAAEELGIDLTGTIISAGGEPPTRAKVAAIRRTGAEFLSGYHFTEAGAIALGCTRPESFDELHLLAHSIEMVQYPREIGSGGDIVPSFHFTTLLESAPKLLLNVEIDDYGEVFERPCGCPFEEMGMTRHIRRIRSFSKLTGEGVTLVGSDMVRILEEVLPGRFGGSALDYQLLEEEDERGFTRLSVVVSPRVELADEGQVIEAVFEALGQGGADAVISQKMWEQAGTIQVKRMEPVWTARGKLLPLHLASRNTADRRARPNTDSR